MATGIVQVAWILSELRRRCPHAKPYLDWAKFAAAEGGMFLWEAFVTDRAKAATTSTTRPSPSPRSAAASRTRWSGRQ